MYYVKLRLKQVKIITYAMIWKIMSLNYFTVNCDGDFFVILTFDVFVTNEIVSLSLYQLQWLDETKSYNEKQQEHHR